MGKTQPTSAFLIMSQWRMSIKPPLMRREGYYLAFGGNDSGFFSFL